MSQLDAFPNAILVGGCQRSGTTVLSEVISDSEGIVRHWKDPGMGELTAARILAGIQPCESRGRSCFQTTYLGQHIDYYDRPGSFQLVWVIRNPYSTVRSLVYNWPEAALNEMFRRAVLPTLPRLERLRVRLLRERRLTQVEKACLHYRSKLEQLLRLSQKLPHSRLFVVSYDELVQRGDEILPTVFEYVRLRYRATYAQRFHRESIRKHDSLKTDERRIIQRLCEPTYRLASLVADRCLRAVTTVP